MMIQSPRVKTQVAQTLEKSDFSIDKQDLKGEGDLEERSREHE